MTEMATEAPEVSRANKGLRRKSVLGSGASCAYELHYPKPFAFRCDHVTEVSLMGHREKGYPGKPPLQSGVVM